MSQEAFGGRGTEGEIVRTDYYLGTDGIFYTMRLTAECLEDIAETVEIP